MKAHIKGEVLRDISIHKGEPNPPIMGSLQQEILHDEGSLVYRWTRVEVLEWVVLGVIYEVF